MDKARAELADALRASVREERAADAERLRMLRELTASIGRGTS